MKKIFFSTLIVLSLFSCNNKASNGNIIEPTIDKVVVEEYKNSLDSTSLQEENKVSEEIAEKPKTELNPEDYSKFHDNALTLLMNGDLDNALIDINKALEIRPNEADSYYVRGNINQQKGNLDDALDDFVMAIGFNPRHSDATMKCAIIYGKQNNRTMSCIYMKKACDLGVSEACSGYSRFCN